VILDECQLNGIEALFLPRAALRQAVQKMNEYSVLRIQLFIHVVIEYIQKSD
jgi:hypothetical protein